MKNKIIMIALLTCTLLSCTQISRKEMPFSKYDFKRGNFNKNDLEYMLGNAEMGGLADIRGVGFKKLWFTDIWENPEARKALLGPLLKCDEFSELNFNSSDFSNHLKIKNGIYTTNVRIDRKRAYKSVIFFSHTDKNLLIIKIENIGSKTQNWSLFVPTKNFALRTLSKNTVVATNKKSNPFTKTAWALRTSIPFIEEKKAIIFKVNPGQSQLLKYSVTSHFDTTDFEQLALNTVNTKKTFSQLINGQIKSWNKTWSKAASIILPEGEYAKWFYRSLYEIYATAGAEHFLPGELQFARPDADWKMHAFTYGHGGWPVWVFACIGDSERAFNMINSLYKPDALKQNVKILFPKLGKIHLFYRGQDKGYHTYLKGYNPNAITFAHEIDFYGKNISFANSDRHWDWQRHIDGFAAALFHLIDRYYPDSSFTFKYSYPVLRGTAEMWSSLVKWNIERKIYFLPPLLSLSENIMEKSVLDAVLAAQWNLHTAYKYAEKLGLDKDIREKWLNIYNKLYVPQNKSFYLEYLDDTQKRTGGGYFGIRAFAYFGFPLLEEITNINRTKARRSLDLAWERNNHGKGMITFISNWFALTEAYLGNGDRAFEISKKACSVLDSSHTAMCEVFDYQEDGSIKKINPYFNTGYDAFALVPITMMMQSYDSKIKLFPAMPHSIQNAAFYDLPAEQGIRVFAEMKNGRLIKAVFKKNGKIIYRTKNDHCVKIINQIGHIKIERDEEN